MTVTHERVEEIRANHVAWIKYQSPLVTFTTGELLAFIDAQAEEILKLRDQLLDKCIDDTDARVTTLLADRVILEQEIKSITAEKNKLEYTIARATGLTLHDAKIDAEGYLKLLIAIEVQRDEARAERDRLAARVERLEKILWELVKHHMWDCECWHCEALARDDEEKGK